MARGLGLDEPWDDDRCGTYAGYRAHHHLGERPCPPCMGAAAAYLKEWRHRDQPGPIRQRRIAAANGG
jgi:hypothetical protein